MNCATSGDICPSGLPGKDIVDDRQIGRGRVWFVPNVMQEVGLYHFGCLCDSVRKAGFEHINDAASEALNPSRITQYARG